MTVSEQFLKQLAEKAKVSEEFVKEEFEKKKQEFPDNPDAALYQLTVALKSHKRSPAVPAEGMFLGMSQPFDWTTKQKNAQIKELNRLLDQYNEEETTQDIVDELIDTGHADPQSTPNRIIWLDTIKKFKSGKENPNYGKPWKSAAETAIMNLYGVAKPSDDSAPMRKFNMTVSAPEYFEDKGGLNNLELKADIQLFRPFTTKMLFYPDKCSDTENVFNLSSVTEFEYHDPVDVMAFCKKFIPDQVTTVSNLEEFYEKHGATRDTFAVFEGGVQNMRMRPSPIGTRTIYVDDPYQNPLDMFDNEDGIVPDLPIEVPQHIPLDFARGTRAVFVGQPNKRGKWIPGENGEKGYVSKEKFELYATALGIYPIPEYTVKAKKAGKEADDSGW